MMREEKLNKLYFIRCSTPALQYREAKNDYSQQFQKTRAHLHVRGGSKGGDAAQYWRRPSPVYRYTQLQPSVNIYAPLFTLYDRIRTLNSSYSHLVLSTLCWCWTLLIVVQYSGTSFKEEGLGPTTSWVAGGRRPINWGSAVSEVKWQCSANYPQTEDQARTDQDDYLCCSLRRFQPHRKEGWWWESLFSQYPYFRQKSLSNQFLPPTNDARGATI